MSDDRYLYISALQHYAYCPRQFALIHVEQAWEENYFTAHGQLLHERVDSKESETRKDMRFERSVALKSEKYKIKGRMDLLEVHLQDGKPVKYYPVEYKRGKPKKEDWDKVQLCAQVLCIEEMKDTQIQQAALFYWATRRRLVVDMDNNLRNKTIDYIEKSHEILSKSITPAPTSQKSRCKACSLIDLCEPDSMRVDHSEKYINSLFEDIP